MGIKKMMTKAGQRVGNRIARLSTLSPEQLQQVEEQRKQYLSEMPGPEDPKAVLMTEKFLAAHAVEIYNAYLPQIHHVYAPVARTAEYGEPFRSANNIRYINITKWVTDKKENSLEKLVNVYEVLSNEECNIALIFHRDMKKTDVYLAVTNTKNADDNNDVENYMQRVEDAIRGNFPGSEWIPAEEIGTVPCLKNSVSYSVASATNIPTEKSEKFASQTIEKLLDGIVPDKHSKEYTLILLATPVQDISQRKMRLAEIYSGLMPYAAWDTQYTFNESGALGSSATFGVNVGASAGIQHGQNQSATEAHGTTDSDSRTETDSTNRSDSDSYGMSETNSQGKSTSDSTGRSQSTSTGETKTEGTSHMDGTNSSQTKGSSTGANVGVSREAGIKLFGLGLSGKVDVGINHSRSKSRTSGTSTADTTTASTAKSATKTAAENVSHTIGETMSQAKTNSTTKTVAIVNDISNFTYK